MHLSRQQPFNFIALKLVIEQQTITGKVFGEIKLRKKDKSSK